MYFAKHDSSLVDAHDYYIEHAGHGVDSLVFTCYPGI